MKNSCNHADPAIAVSALSIDWLEAGSQLEILQEAGADYLHWPILDGQIEPDYTFGSNIINRVRQKTSLPFLYHLMVEEPGRLFETFDVRDDDIFTVHQEFCRNLHRDLIALRRRGAKVGLALRSSTPLTVLDYIIEDVDYTHLLISGLGKSESYGLSMATEKVSQLQVMIQNMELSVRIGVDGMVNDENAASFIAAGAGVLVVEAALLFRNGMDPSEALNKLRNPNLKG